MTYNDAEGGEGGVVKEKGRSDEGKSSQGERQKW